MTRKEVEILIYDGDYNIVMSHIHNIREKIEDNPSEPVYIQPVWGGVTASTKI